MNKKVNLRIDDNVFGELKVLAEEDNRTLTYHVNEALKQYVQDKARQGKTMQDASDKDAIIKELQQQITDLQDVARQSKTREDKARRCKTLQDDIIKYITNVSLTPVKGRKTHRVLLPNEIIPEGIKRVDILQDISDNAIILEMAQEASK